MSRLFGFLMMVAAICVSCQGTGVSRSVPPGTRCLDPGKELLDYSWSPSGNYVSVTARDMDGGVYRVWRVGTDNLSVTEVLATAADLSYRASAVDDQGRVYWIEDDPPQIQLWRSDGIVLNQLMTLPGLPLKMAFTPKGLLIHVGLWDGDVNGHELVSVQPEAGTLEQVASVGANLWLGSNGDSWVQSDADQSHNAVFRIHSSGGDTTVTISGRYLSQGSLAHEARDLVYYDSSSGTTWMRPIQGGIPVVLSKEPAWNPSVSSRGQLGYLTVFNMRPNRFCLADI